MMETEYDRFKKRHPIRLRWEVFKLKLSEWWYGVWHAEVAKPTPPRKILHNRCQCRKCGDTIESTHVHEFVSCQCGAIFTDGGTDYIRRGGELDNIIDLTEYEGG